MDSPSTPRIVIEELPAIELLNEEDMARIFGAGRFRPRVEGLETREVLSAVFTVNTTQDVLGHANGTLSLRQAILDANAAGGTATDPIRIQFDLPENDPNHLYYKNDGVAGKVSTSKVAVTSAADDSLISDIDPDWNHSWWRLTPTSLLPTVATPVVLDGYSQAGSNKNTVANGSDAVIRVELDGSGIPLSNQTFYNYGPGNSAVGGIGGPTVLKLTSSDSTVTGLAVNGLQADVSLIGRIGIWVSGGSNNHIIGNFVGTDVSGTLAPNGLPDYSVSTHPSSYGIHVADGAQHNFIGTDGDGVNDPAERNLISGLNGTSVVFFAVGSGPCPGTPVGIWYNRSVATLPPWSSSLPTLT